MCMYFSVQKNNTVLLHLFLWDFMRPKIHASTFWKKTKIGLLLCVCSKKVILYYYILIEGGFMQPKMHASTFWKKTKIDLLQCVCILVCKKITLKTVNRKSLAKKENSLCNITREAKSLFSFISIYLSIYTHIHIYNVYIYTIYISLFWYLYLYSIVFKEKYYLLQP